MYRKCTKYRKLLGRFDHFLKIGASEENPAASMIVSLVGCTRVFAAQAVRENDGDAILAASTFTWPDPPVHGFFGEFP